MDKILTVPFVKDDLAAVKSAAEILWRGDRFIVAVDSAWRKFYLAEAPARCGDFYAVGLRVSLDTVEEIPTILRRYEIVAKETFIFDDFLSVHDDVADQNYRLIWLIFAGNLADFRSQQVLTALENCAQNYRFWGVFAEDENFAERS